MRQFPKPDGAQSPFAETIVIDGLTICASGQVAFDEEQLICPESTFSECDPNTARDAAALCAANILQAVGCKIGSLNRITCVSHITVYVRSDADLAALRFVIDGISELVQMVFGEKSKHPRDACAVAELPPRSSMKVELILQMGNLVRAARGLARRRRAPRQQDRP